MPNPPVGRKVGDIGHVTDHNDIAEVLPTLLSSAAASATYVPQTAVAPPLARFWADGVVPLPKVSPYLATVVLTQGTGIATTVPTPKANAVDSYCSFDATNQSAFRYLATGGVVQNSRAAPYPNSYSVGFPYITGPNEAFYAARIEHVFDGQIIEYAVKPVASSFYRVVVNGEYLGQYPVTHGGLAGAANQIKLTFPDRRQRHIILEIVGTRFYGAWCQTTDTIVAPTDPLTRVLWAGDSYTGGANLVSQIGSYANVASRILNIRDAIVSGVGGSGYLAGTTLRNRLNTDVIAYSPSVVLVSMGHNDTAFTAAAIQAEAVLLFDAIRTQLPNAKLIVLGPIFEAGLATVYTPIQAAIFAAAAGRAHATVDTVSSPVFTAGNTALFMSNDTVHPTPAGADALGKRIAAAISETLSLLP